MYDRSHFGATTTTLQRGLKKSRSRVGGCPHITQRSAQSSRKFPSQLAALLENKSKTLPSLRWKGALRRASLSALCGRSGALGARALPSACLGAGARLRAALANAASRRVPSAGILWTIRTLRSDVCGLGPIKPMVRSLLPTATDLLEDRSFRPRSRGSGCGSGRMTLRYNAAQPLMRKRVARIQRCYRRDGGDGTRIGAPACTAVVIQTSTPARRSLLRRGMVSARGSAIQRVRLDGSPKPVVRIRATWHLRLMTVGVAVIRCLRRM